jgi:hypothetical protein
MNGDSLQTSRRAIGVGIRNCKSETPVDCPPLQRHREHLQTSSFQREHSSSACPTIALHYFLDGNSQMNDVNVRLGVIGCGGFGLFALQHFTQVPGVTLVGMAGTHRPAALAAARRFGVNEVESVENLVQRDDIDMVYIATPPFLHYEQALAALDAGKHAICEKPLALTIEQANEMLRRADERDLLLVANLMQRYNPLFDIVRQLIESGALGEPLHGYFENYAADEGLPPDHWFWTGRRAAGFSSSTESTSLICSPAGWGRVRSWRRRVRNGQYGRFPNCRRMLQAG